MLMKQTSKHYLYDHPTSYTEMTPAEWAQVADNPRQRDTELHAKKAIKYLIHPVPPHREVKMAWLPDGTKIKLDGHTRAYLWMLEKIPVPETLEVGIVRLDTIADAIDAYGWYDSAQAAEKGTDVVQGAFRANGLKPTSHMLRSGRINTSLVRLYRFVTEANQPWTYDTIEEAVRFFQREIMMLDALEPTGKLFLPGVVMAFLITAQRDREDAATFWSDYAAEKGTKVDGQLDPVQALTDAVMSVKTGRGTRDITSEIFKKALAAFFCYQRNQKYSVVGSGLRPVSDTTMKRYIHKVRL